MLIFRLDPKLVNQIRSDLSEEHCLAFGQYINSIKEIISKIPSRERGNTHIELRVAQGDDWRSFKKENNAKKSKKIYFRDEETEEFNDK
jgi:hypothetical protein